jgi:signal-transduction protein with cAMP-binding, CBS, and nucleotidyltransferase domain
MKDSIQPYINRRVVVLNQNLPATVAARALHERGVGSAVVADKHGHMVGIVTDRDLSSQVLGFELPADTPISEIMTTDILKVKKSASISDVAKVMEVNGIRRVPVIEKTENGREKCIGIVTLDDLIASQSVDPRLLSKIVKAQIFRQVRKFHSSQKNEGRRDQTLNRFNKVMADQMNVPKATAERMAFCLLKEIVQRLTSTGAAHFIAQLPSILHEDLLDLPAGPNLKIN